ncbi:MAG: hypothetical protein ACEQSX_00465 [Baekduiaceae bacterium]
MTNRHVALPFAVLALLASAATADAATKNGITPLSPKNNTTVGTGATPTFKMKVRGKGQVWVHVCKSKAKDADGVICSDESIGQARKNGRNYEYTPKFFDFPDFWLNSPGTYYWQAHRIDCSTGTDDCKKEGPIRKLKVST